MSRINGSTIGKALTALLIMLTLGACAVSKPYQLPTPGNTPAAWQNAADTLTVSAGWLTTLNDPQLTQWVNEALTGNHELAAQQAQVEQARQQLHISAAPRLPELNAILAGSRRRTPAATTDLISNTAELSLDLRWEIDVWGKLRDNQKQAALNLAAAEARLDSDRQQLVAAVGNAWYDVVEAQQLLSLYQQRLHNLGSNLDIIKAGYRQGLNSALDVYLSRNSLQEEAARTTAQQQVLANANRHLQVLLGRYPDGQPFPQQALPVINAHVPAGLPSELISRRPELRSTWLELMAADVAIAIAHKQRFPSLSLTGSVGQSSSDLHNLLQSDHAVWSLAGSLLQPLFNAGELATREQQARSRLTQLEQQYLNKLLQTFADVESALQQEDSLATQLQQYLEAEQNALAAETLAFEQYQRGLVSYTTVLESQRRAVDAQSTVIRLRRQRLANRIALHLALGGGFEEHKP